MYVRNFVGSPAWLEGTILDQTGPVSFRIQLSDGRVRKRHIDHVRIRYPEDTVTPNLPEVLEGPEPVQADGTASTHIGQGQSTAGVRPPENDPQELNQSQQPRRSGRVRRPPDRLY